MENDEQQEILPVKMYEEPYYRSLGKSFKWGEHFVRQAVQVVGEVLLDGCFIERRILVDAVTYEEITFLDTGELLLREQEPGTGFTVHKVIEADPTKRGCHERKLIERGKEK